MPSNICLIVPCYNEASRLDFREFQALRPGIVCVLVDDGSVDGTGDLIIRHESAALRLVRLTTNVGKAEAIRQGFLHARRAGWLDDVEWVGYWDADLAAPLSEIDNFVRYAALAGTTVDGILGSRIYKLGSRIVRSYKRHLAGRVFTTAAAALLDVGCYDSQCGAKLFRVDAASKAFDEPFVSRWIFDLEILARLRGKHLTEYPLHRWTHKRGSKLSVLKVAVPTLLDLLRIRRRYGRLRSSETVSADAE